MCVYIYWLVHVCDMARAYMRHNAFVCVMGLRGGFICVTWLIHMCDMTRLDYVCYRRVLQVIRGSWLVYVRDMSQAHVWHDAFICVTWRLDMCGETCVCVWQQGISVTGWRRLIGSPKLQTFSTKEPLNIGHFCGKWPVKIMDPMTPPCKWVMTVCIHTHIHMCIL